MGVRVLLVLVAVSCGGAPRATRAPAGDDGASRPDAGAAADAKEATPPEALVGVKPALYDQPGWTRTAFEVLATDRQLGGRTVVVWQESAVRRWTGSEGYQASDSQDGEWYGVADAKTKEVLFFSPIARTWTSFDESMSHDTEEGSEAYTPSWKDLDGDGTDELIFTTAETVDTIHQIRWGMLTRVSAEAARCPHDDTPFGPPVERAAELPAPVVARIGTAFASGASEAVFCAIWDAYHMTASYIAPPEDSDTMLLAPDRTRAYYVDDGGTLSTATPDGAFGPWGAQPEPDFSHDDPWADQFHRYGEPWTVTIDQLAGTTAGGHFYLLVEAKSELVHHLDEAEVGPGGELGQTEVQGQSHDAFVLDSEGAIVATEIVARAGLLSRAVTIADGNGDKILELTVAPAAGAKGESVAWSWDKRAKKWTRKVTVPISRAGDAAVPKALVGVTPPGLRPEAGWTRQRIEVLDAARKIGGTTVVVWKETDVQRLDDRTEDATWLGIADVKTRAVLFWQPLTRKWKETRALRAADAGEFEWRHAWEDADGDGQPELIFTAVSGTDPANARAERVIQPRFGRFFELTRKAARCKADVVKLGKPIPKTAQTQALAQLHKDIDGGEDAVRCAWWAVVASGADLALPPADGLPVYVAPSADPERHVYYAERGGPLMLLTVKADGASAAPWDGPLRPDFAAEDEQAAKARRDDDEGNEPDGPWSQQMEQFGGVVADGTLYLFFDGRGQELDESGGYANWSRQLRTSRDAFLIDPEGMTEIAIEALERTGRPLRVASFTDTDQDGIPELSITPGMKGKGKKVVWKYVSGDKTWIATP